MKADISEEGELVIKPENRIEAYALRMWVSENKRYDEDTDRNFLTADSIVILEEFYE